MATLIHTRRIGFAAIVAGLAGLAGFAPNAVLAADVKIGGKPLSFEPPSGVCLFEKKHPVEGRVVARMRELYTPSEIMVWAFIDCDEKPTWLKNPNSEIKRSGGVVVTKRKTFVEAAASMTRAQYIGQVANIELWQPIYRDYDTRLQNTGARLKPSQFISSDSDEFAAYIGSTTTVLVGREWITHTDLSAQTIINGLPVGLTLSRTQGTIDEMLPELKVLIRAMIERNERRPTEQSDAEFSSYRNEDVRPVIATN